MRIKWVEPELVPTSPFDRIAEEKELKKQMNELMGRRSSWRAVSAVLQELALPSQAEAVDCI